MSHPTTQAALLSRAALSLQQQTVILPLQVVRHRAEFRGLVLARDGRREGPDRHVGHG